MRTRKYTYPDNKEWVNSIWCLFMYLNMWNFCHYRYSPDTETLTLQFEIHDTQHAVTMHVSRDDIDTFLHITNLK